MELVAPVEIMFTNVRVTASIKIVIIIHFIPCRMFQHAQCISLKLNFKSIFQNIRHGLFDILKDRGWRSSFVLAAEELISEPLFWILQLLQFGISVMSLQLFWYFIFSSISAIWYLRSVSVIFFGVIFCLPLLQNLVFRLSSSFCNLVFLFCLCNYFGISSSLQFL